MNRSPIAFYAGERALLESCHNRRTEVWYKMRKWLCDGGAIPDEADLRDDLVGPEYSTNSRGQIQLERKQDMKKRGLASPDLADALAVTFGAEVRKKERNPVMRSAGRQPDYDAYDPLGLGG